jgi:hypothetical protein
MCSGCRYWGLVCYNRKGITYIGEASTILRICNPSGYGTLPVVPNVRYTYELYGVHGMSKKDETSVLIPHPSPKPLRHMTCGGVTVGTDGLEVVVASGNGGDAASARTTGMTQ